MREHLWGGSTVEERRRRLEVLGDFCRLRPQLSLFPAIVVPVPPPLVVPFASDWRLLGNFGCSPPV